MAKTEAEHQVTMTAVPGKTKPERPKTEPWHRRFLLFTRLLLAADPTALDYGLLAVGLVVAAVAGSPFPIMAIYFGELVDELNGATCAAQGQTTEDPRDYTAAVHANILIMVYIAIGAFFAIYIYILAWGIIGQRLAQRLRKKYLQALLRQPPSYFDQHANAGEVSSRLHGDIAAVQAGTGEKVGIFVATIGFCLTSFIIAFIKQSKLAAMLLFMVPCFLLSSVLGGTFTRKYNGQIGGVVAKAASLAGETLRNVSVVHAFGAQDRLEARFAELSATARDNGMKRSRVTGVQAGVLYFVAYAGNALAYWQGSRLIADSVAREGINVSVGNVYTVILVLVDACVMLGNVAPMMPLFSGATAAYERLNRDMAATSVIDATSDEGKAIPKGHLDLDFKDVSFAYASRPQPVLRNVDLSIPAGSYTAIVGLSGSGKSTMAALITRLYDPTGGSININGTPITDLNVRSLRSRIGFVQQEPSLLNTSVLANIALGLANSPKEEHQHLKPFLQWHALDELAENVDSTTLGPEATEIISLVRNAAAQADATTFIPTLEHGYATMTGPGGSLISGGQRQRIALAQALIRDPDILVLDEATASVDSATEKRIQDAVEKAAKGRTVVSIAHRLSTIRNADNIVVMDAGEVVEQGKYVDLMAVDGPFSRMARLQSVGTMDKDDANSLSGETLDSASIPDVDVEEKREEAPKEEPTEAKVVETTTTDLGAKRSISFITHQVSRIIRPYLPHFIVAILAAIIVGATFSSSGVLIGHLVGALSPCSNPPDQIRSLGAFFAGLMFMLAVVEFFANFLSWALFGYLAERLLYAVRVLSFRSLMEQDLSWHQAETSTKLLGIITKDTAAIGGFSGSTMSTVLSILVNFAITIVLSHIIAWKIALVCLASVPILLGSGIMQLKTTARYHERSAGAFDEATALAVETVHSIRTVAALSLEQQTMDSFMRLLRGPQQIIVKAAAYTNIWLAMHHSVGTFVYCLSYWWGTKLITRGEYTQTQFIIVQIAMLVSAKLWGTMFALAPEFAKARIAASRVFTIVSLSSAKDLTRGDLRSLETEHDDDDVESDGESKGPVPNTPRGVKITFDNVSFTYPNRPTRPVLENISLTIQPGQFCGLVGPSGAGKSTIMALVQRLYNPTSGTITLDGVDISRQSSAFRSAIALVPQDPVLFNGTVKFNISLGAAPGHEATDREIEEACRAANVHDVIAALPDGYDTDCGASAQRFSGGQRQRLAIARALVRKPRLLLLDESTSALDATTEAALQEGLARVSRGTTVLAITHRLHTVQKADVILVVEGGEIVDKGKHAELMERRESYRINAMQQMLQ